MFTVSRFKKIIIVIIFFICNVKINLLISYRFTYIQGIKKSLQTLGRSRGKLRTILKCNRFDNEPFPSELCKQCFVFNIDYS